MTTSKCFSSQKYILLVLFSLTFALFERAHAVFYIKGALGPSTQKDNSFAGGNIDYSLAGLGASSLIFGLSLGPQLATELELTARSLNIDSIDGGNYDGDLDASAILINGLYKVPMNLGYTVYMGAGFGVLSAELYDAVFDNFADGSSFAAQLILGLEAEVTDNLDFTVEFKHLNAVDLELSGTSGAFNEDLNYRNNSVMVGLKYNF
jgi:opacity protein-like surface antigen